MDPRRPDPVEYLAEVARAPAAVAYKAHVLAESALAPGLRSVDVGCGPATDLQQAADEVRPGGLVVGLDVDTGMLAAASRRVTDGVALIAGDAHALPLAPRSVDRLRTDRALQHMAFPPGVLREFRRVLAPGGIAVVAEPDWRTLVIDGGSRDTAQRFVDFTCERVVRNATVGRDVARLGPEAGFLLSRVVGFPAVLRDVAQADRIFGLSRNALRATQAGYLSASEADRWLADLARGPSQVAVTLFVTTLVVPED